MTDRIPLGQLTSDHLDALYEQLEAAEDTEAQRQLATAREALASASIRAARMEHATKEAAELRVRLEDAEAGITAAIRQRKTAEDRARRAEAERDTARQHAAAIAAQRDRLRQRMNSLADRWDAALAVDKPYARILRAEISVAPFHGEHTVVQQYRADDSTTKWAARCWGTETCDGWLSLDHDTERWAEIARDRHIAEDHSGPTEAEHVAAAWNTLQTMVNRVRHATTGTPTPAEQQRDQLAELAREILYTSHNITSGDWARWRETLDTITDQEQR